MDYFKKLQQLLKIERDEDRLLYKQITESSSITARRSNGLAWYPVAIKDTELGRGDYLTVEVERTTHQDITHQFRAGVSAILFSNHDAKNNQIEGTIVYQGGNRLKINLRTDELPEWSRDGKLGIDLLFDENSYDEMQNALQLAINMAEKKEEGRLIKILTGEQQPSFHNELPPLNLPRLNASQQAAVNKILAANELAIVHGPRAPVKPLPWYRPLKR